MQAQENLYFIALVPPEPLCSQIWALKEEMRDKWSSQASLNSPPHITLHMPFTLKENREKAVVQGLQELAEGYKPFSVELDGYGAFPPRVIYLHVTPSDALKRLQSDVGDLMKRGFHIFGEEAGSRPFRPHLTLASRDLKKEAFEKAWQELREKEFSGRWMAQGITLLRHTGQRWEELSLAEFADASVAADDYA
ncbi:2'-5' RNA ligase family protein [Cesiribacter andamanensis]|uniref:2'-5' RNA ligase n=1 Tax=Cesiribacter andamanensis AMV16 TaxID=1279009 RepID=M7NVV7_9BACT|nr:2'-5' RNA ligase family protein [Cesiribacter andamanensis]EMR02609.1 hypothetical protein ADICEAN_02265 [Cesiribacter andamanensis AMV16]